MIKISDSLAFRIDALVGVQISDHENHIIEFNVHGHIYDVQFQSERDMIDIYNRTVDTMSRYEPTASHSQEAVISFEMDMKHNTIN